MFDTIRHVVQSPERIDVHEHRAPTDASIRLYLEMEEKARASVVEAYVSGSNEVKGSVIRTDRSIVVAFKVNGKAHQVELGDVEDRLALLGTSQAARALLDELAKAIRDELVEPLCEQVAECMRKQPTLGGTHG